MSFLNLESSAEDNHPAGTNPSPQFATAEYVGGGAESCQYCHAPIGSSYYRVGAVMACAACGEKLREAGKERPGAYPRALLFGIGAAILGVILYATFAIETGLVIGYVSLAVGWLVGKAVTKGSGGIGKRKYQITAVVLTYAAVSMAAVPIWIHYAGKEKPTEHEQRQSDRELGRQTSSAPPLEQQPHPVKAKQSMATAFGILALIGLASPVLEIYGSPFSGLIGLVILFVGLRIAWGIAAGTNPEMFGPFEKRAETPQGMAHGVGQS